MTTTSPPSGTIVVGVDGSSGADEALLWAADQAAIEKRPVTILHANDPLTTSGALSVDGSAITAQELITSARQVGQRILDEAVERVAWKHPDLEVTPVRREVDPRVALLDLAGEASLVVVGSRGRGPLKSLILGSVSVAVMRHAGCPTVVVRPRPTDVARSGILVGIDGTARSHSTLERAYREASLRATTLTVVHCIRDGEAGATEWLPMHPDSPRSEDARVLVAETLGGMREKFPDVAVEVVLARGAADLCLVDLSAKREMVVLGRHGTSVLDQWGFGSLATTVLEHAHTVVLVVP